MITGINESKVLTEHTSCEWKCNFDGRKCNSNQNWNNDRHCVCERDLIWNPATSRYEND